MTKSKSGPPRRDKDGYYRLESGEKLLSVTNIKKFGIPLDLTGWAGWEAGWCAMESLPKLVQCRGYKPRRKLAYWVGQASERKRDEAARLGSAVHKKIESVILGRPFDEPDEDEQPFMESFYKFMEIERPAVEAAELVLANPEDGWAGTADAFLTLPNLGPALWCSDWKTGSTVSPDFALQLSAYRRATRGWLQDGTEVEPPKTEGAVVVHIRPEKYPDTGYRIYPLDTSDAVYECFLTARKTAVEWAKGLESTVLGEPYEPGQAVLDAEVVEEVA